MEPAHAIPILVVIALILAIGVFAGRLVRLIRLPALMGFLLLGVLLGPSAIGVVTEPMLGQLEFITELALGMVALAIGLELSFRALREQRLPLIRIVAWESLLTFALVGTAIFLLTGRLPVALVFGAVAVTTAPAGKVAVIQETRARGPLTRALLAVVGLDDAAAILIFGFALAFAKYLLALEIGDAEAALATSLAMPLIEIALSIGIGAVLGFGLGMADRLLGRSRDVFILVMASVFLMAGLAEVMQISLVLTAMTAGIILVNAQPRETAERVGQHVAEVTPFMFVLFFALAGAHLDLAALPQLGLVGTVYIVARSAGKIGGCWIGARRGGADMRVARYLGIGILSQAGLAIGLALIALQELAPLGPEAEQVARTVIVTITASSVIFELVGPVLTRTALTRAGETGRAGQPD